MTVDSWPINFFYFFIVAAIYMIDADDSSSKSAELNKKEIATIVSAFERYEYTIIHYFGDEKFENEIHSNYRHLMSYLDI